MLQDLDVGLLSQQLLELRVDVFFLILLLVLISEVGVLEESVILIIQHLIEVEEEEGSLCLFRGKRLDSVFLL